MSDGEVTGGDILALWKVANVQLPRVADVFVDASKCIDGTSGAKGAFTHNQTSRQGTFDAPSRVYFSWSQLRNELQHILALTAQNTLDASSAVNTAINVFCGTDNSNAKAVTSAGSDYQNMLTDPDEVNPNRPGENPPTGDDKPGKPAEPDDYDSPGDEKG